MVNNNVIIVALIVCSLMTPVSMLGAWLVLTFKQKTNEEIDKEELSIKEIINLIMSNEGDKYEEEDQ